MNKAAVLRLIAQLAFGVDTIIGLGMYVLLSFAFQEPANLWFLLFAGFCAYFPDLDFIYFLTQSRDARKWGHWRIGFHHPLLLLPTVGVGVWWVASLWLPEHRPYLTTLAVACITGHFIHDSTKMGFHWLSPFNRDGGISLNPLRWTHFHVSRRGVRLVSEVELKQVYADIARSSESGGAGNEVATRIEEVTPAQIRWFNASVMGLIVLVLFVGCTSPF